MGQALLWFAPLFEKQSPILNNFEIFLEAFAEVWRTRQAMMGYNKDSVATTRDTLCICLCIRFQAISMRHQLG